MQLIKEISKYNKGNKYLLCAIDLFCKVCLDCSYSYKWVDQDSEFYNNYLKDFFKIINIEIYSTYNDGKSVVAERFIRTLKNKVFKHMTAKSKNVYFDVLDDIVNKYNNTVHRTIKLRPIYVTDNSYVECNEDFNKKKIWI